ncbi:helix-turn-helix domain-containing protein [Streptomyces sp. NPDC048172]|uniref:helix-turn-helix domain-containing protein n=1 Tax=Streptomyces sp. NPDC048172 TaxID=3365505 RepID=UPI00371BFC7A
MSGAGDGGLRITQVGGRWRVTRAWPPWLRPYLHSYVGYWETGSPVPYEARVVPTGRAVVVINLREPFTQVRRLRGESGKGGVVGSLIGGLEDGPRVLAHPGGQEAIRLELTPVGAYRLFGVPMRELANRVVELDDVLGPGARLLVERLAGTGDWSARFDLLDRALLSRLERGPDPAPEVSHAWRLLAGTGGTVPVARIATEVGWSQGYLVRRFTQQIGLAPKAAARVLRFHRAMGLLTVGEAHPATVAEACGFYDQSHLNREFRALAGTTPGQVTAARFAEGALAR